MFCRTISAGLLSVYILIAAVVYLSFIGRFSFVFVNRVVAPLVLLISALLILVVGGLPFLQKVILDARNAEFDLDDLHAKNMQFFASMAAGEKYTPLSPGWRGASDLGIVNQRNGASLAGGWYTGPGLAKFTYPQVRYPLVIGTYSLDATSFQPTALRCAAVSTAAAVLRILSCDRAGSHDYVPGAFSWHTEVISNPSIHEMTSTVHEQKNGTLRDALMLSLRMHT
jgi:hypothetical protein